MMVEEQNYRATNLLILAWVLLSISFSILGLRLWAHVFGPRNERDNVALSGALILISAICELIHSALLTVGCQHGLGEHFQELSSFDQTESVKFIMIIQGIAILTPMFGRISFSFFLLRIVGNLRIWQRPTLWGTIAVQLIITTITIIQIYSQCGSKVSALWDPAVAATAQCQNPMVQTIIGYVQSSLNSACDLILTVLPGSIVWKLQQTVTKKIVLAIFLCLSVFAFAASLVKCVQIGNLAARGDITWNFLTLTIWVCIENNIIIIIASIPTLRPLMRTTKHSTSTGYISKPHSTVPWSSHHASQSGTVHAYHYEVPLNNMGKRGNVEVADEDTERILKDDQNAIVRKKEVKVVYGDVESISERSDRDDSATTGKVYPG